MRAPGSARASSIPRARVHAVFRGLVRARPLPRPSGLPAVRPETPDTLSLLPYRFAFSPVPRKFTKYRARLIPFSSPVQRIRVFVCLADAFISAGRVFYALNVEC